MQLLIAGLLKDELDYICGRSSQIPYLCNSLAWLLYIEMGLQLTTTS